MEGMRFAGTIVGVCIAAHALHVRPARGDTPREEARSIFERANVLMENENWEVALTEFQRSFDLYPTRAALFNLGMCQKALFRYVLALATFEEFMRRYESEAPEGQRRSVLTAIEELRGLVSAIDVRANTGGAVISIDGVVVGTTPLPGPVAIEVGSHAVLVEMPGYESASREEVVLTGVVSDVSVTLVELPPPEPVDEGGLESAWFWSAVGLAGAAAVAGTATWLVSDARLDDFDTATRACHGGDSAACSEAISLADEGDRLNSSTIALLALGAAAAAAAATLAFFTDFAGEEPPPAAAGSVSPVIDVDSGSLSGAMLHVWVRF